MRKNHFIVSVKVKTVMSSGLLRLNPQWVKNMGKTKRIPRNNPDIVMSTSTAARMLQLLGLPTLLYQPRVHTNLEVIVLYTQVDEMGPLFITTELVIDR